MKGLTAPYLISDTDRHGNVRLYVRKPGCTKVRIREEPGTEAFFAAYTAALARSVPRDDISGPETAPGAPAAPGSLRWLCQAYMRESKEYLKLATRTRHVRRLVLNRLCQSVDDKGRLNGDKRFAQAQPHHIEELRDADEAHPEAGNAVVKALRQVFKWAKNPGRGKAPLVTSNPAAEVTYRKPNNPDGFHTWTIGEIEQYEERWPIGTKQRLALALLLYVGVRRSDFVTLGKQMMRNRWLRFTEFKGREKIRKDREIPVIDELHTVLEQTKLGNLTFLVTEFGKPFTPDGFGNWFREQCDAAGLPHCSAHGLRKAGATIAAENGATEFELMAMYGWEDPKTAAIYVKKARRKKLAGRSMHLIAKRDSAEIVPLSGADSPTEKKA
jgi:integrase